MLPRPLYNIRCVAGGESFGKSLNIYTPLSTKQSLVLTYTIVQYRKISTDLYGWVCSSAEVINSFERNVH